MIRTNGSEPIILFHRQLIILDDRVGQKAPASLMQRNQCRLALRVRGQFQLQVFPYMDCRDIAMPQLCKGVLNRFALRIEHRLLGSDMDLGLHVSAMPKGDFVLKRVD